MPEISEKNRKMLESMGLDVATFRLCQDLAQNAADKANESIRLVADTAPPGKEFFVTMVALRRLVAMHPAFALVQPIIDTEKARIIAEGGL